MRVALIKPPLGKNLGLEMITFVEPLGLECLAGGLEPAGHTCQIIDMRIDGERSGLSRARAFGADIVGIQCNFTTERYRALRVARAVREKLPDAKILIGGHDASREPEWFQDPAIDAVAVGDGEEIMPHFVTAVERGAGLADVPGLMINTDNGPEYTPCVHAREDIDTLPMPARHLIRDYAPHYYVNFNKPLALLETARGCPFKCNFCSVWKFHEARFREKSPDRVVAELRDIECDNVFITDDIFWLDVKRGRELADAIIQSGIRKYFRVQTRTDIICKFPDLVEKWKECGKLSVFLGLESITDEGLDRINKSNKAENNERAIEILQELGVGYTPNFIVDPQWGREDFGRLRDWVQRMGAYNSGFSVLTPLPGTDLWDEVKQEVNSFDWELYDIAHAVVPTKLSLEEFYEEYAGLWRLTTDMRIQARGRARTYMQLGLALATGKVDFNALRKGMNMSKILGRADTFLKAHRDSSVPATETVGAR